MFIHRYKFVISILSTIKVKIDYELHLYKENILICEDIPLSELAEEYGTPLYVYSKNQIIEKYRLLNGAFGNISHLVCYALKANANHHILQVLAAEGAGADVVSAGELYLALKAGFSPDKIVFAGVGKREDEIEFALNQNIFSFNVESVSELHTISRAALRTGKKARISLRINPDIDAQSHPYITTGLQTTKFGIEASKALEVYTYAATLSSLELVGLHTHIGSQITKVEPFTATANYIAGLIGKLREAGINLTHIDFGGGFGVQYINAVLHEAIRRRIHRIVAYRLLRNFLQQYCPSCRQQVVPSGLNPAVRSLQTQAF